VYIHSITGVMQPAGACVSSGLVIWDANELYQRLLTPPRLRERNIVMSMSVCVSAASISPVLHAQSLPIILHVSYTAVARSVSGGAATSHVPAVLL